MLPNHGFGSSTISCNQEGGPQHPRGRPTAPQSAKAFCVAATSVCGSDSARGALTAPQGRAHRTPIEDYGATYSPRAGPTFPQGEAHSTSREGPQHPSWGGPTAPQRGGPQDLKRVPTAPQGRAHSPPWGCLEHPRGVSQHPKGVPHSTPVGGPTAPQIRALRALTLRDTTPSGTSIAGNPKALKP